MEQVNLQYPFDEVAKLFIKWHRSPKTDVELIRKGGGIVEGKFGGNFLMAKPIVKDCPFEQLRDLTYKFENPNCWFIYCFVGNPQEIILPFELPWVLFFHTKQLKYYQTDRLRSKLNLCKAFTPHNNLLVKKHPKMCQ